MLNAPPIFLILTLSFVIWLHVKLNYSKYKYKSFRQLLSDYQEAESSANVARRRDVEPQHFITIDISRLPFKEYPEDDIHKKLKARQEQALNKSKETMIRFDVKYSNRELKQKYGVANLEIITRYEENLLRYIRALIEWAELLIDAREYIDAEEVLAHSIELGSGVSKSYTMLSDIYFMQNDRNKILTLKEQVLQGKYSIDDEIITNRIVRYMDKRLEDLQ